MEDDRFQKRRDNGESRICNPALCLSLIHI